MKRFTIEQTTLWYGVMNKQRTYRRKPKIHMAWVQEKLRVKTSLKLRCKKAFRLGNFFLVKLNFLHILALIYRRMYNDLPQKYVFSKLMHDKL